MKLKLLLVMLGLMAGFWWATPARAFDIIYVCDPSVTSLTTPATLATSCATVSGGSLTIAGSVGGGTTIGGAMPTTGIAVCVSDGVNCRTPKLDGSDFLYVTLATGLDATNDHIDVAKINGVTVTMGNGVSGTGVQRFTLASDSTGNIATIGTSVTPGTAAGNLGKAEDGAHTSADVGVMALGVANEAGAAISGTDGDYTPIATDRAGNVFVRNTAANQWTYHEDSSNALTDTTVHASCGTGLYNYITSIVFSTNAATAASILFEDSTTTTILGPYYLEAVAGRGMNITFPGGKKQSTSATLVSVTTTGAIAHGLDVQGFCAP